MKCSILESLNERDIKRINARLKRFPMDYENWVFENFSTLAFAINGLIKSIQASGRNEILPDDLIDIQTEEDQILNSEFIGEDDVIDTNYNGDRVAISRMYRTFTDAIIGLSIFDRKTNKNANPNQKSSKGFENLLNEKIFDFKDSLIRKIAILTGISFTPGFDNAIDFEKKINKALAAFISMRNSGTLTERMLQSKVYKEALDAFTILKNFDKLIKKVTPFVGIKAGLEFGQNPNKYEFVGANTLLDKSWTTKEEVSIDDQVSDVVGILLDYFPEFTKDGKTTPVPISRTGFYQVMSAFRDWMAHAPLATMFPPSGEREIVVIQQNRALLKQAREGNEIALKKLWKRFYEIHDADGVGTNFSKNKMRGINNLFDSRLDNQFKKMLWNLAFKTERNIVDIVTVFEGAVSNKQLTDNFKTRQWNSISDVISSRIRTFKYKNPELKKKLFSDYRIDTSDPNNIIIFKGMPYEFTLSLTGNYFGIIWTDPTKKFDNNVGKKLIETILDTLVPEDYATIMEQLAGSDGVIPSLIDLYGNVLGLVLYGSTEGNTLSWNNEGDPRRETVKLGSFRQSTNKLQTFLGVADGVDVASTHKNAAGNNIAAYSLTSMIHQMDQMVLKLQGKDSSFQSNPVLAQFRDMVGKPIVRGDVDIMGKKKAARNLTEPELAYVGIISDFWNSFIKVYKDDDVQYITFQNTTFSDKNTHFKIPYSKHFKIYRDVTLKEAIQGIIDGKKQYIKTFETAIFEQRRDGYQVILNNLIADILKATENIVDNQNIIALRNAKTNVDKINAVTAVLTDRSVNLEKLFRSKGIEFIPDIHAKVNEVLFHAFETYLLKDKTSFEKRMQTQKRLFVKDLINFGFEMNFYMDPKNIGELRKQLDSSWYNDLTGEVYFYKGDLDGDFELNPMLEAYFYSDVLLSNSYNELLFGRTFFHPAKYKAVSYDPELGDENDFDENGNKTDTYYAHVEASQLLASYKRTVIAGATFHSFLPMKYGISPDINVAVVSDLTADVWNMLGISDVVDALDGSGLSSPYQAYLENLSLLDAKVGWDKKTIFGDNSGRYGAPLLVKWAVYALTNSRRRMSDGSNHQAEHLFKKMHDQPINANNIRLEKYYNFSLENAPVSYFDREGNPITYSNALYRFDELTGQYYLISDVRSENGVAYWNEYVANENGTIDYKQVTPRSRTIESIYDLDQIFGGARVMSINPKTKQLEYSDANIEIVAKIICNENLKDKFIGYVINKSACKVGARNINPTSIFVDKGENDEPLWTFKMSLMFGGIQMNADHELAHSDVTEMSQMISALIQNGYFTDEVNEIYKEIGQIVAESLGIETKLLTEENFEGIHLMLGKNLIDEFNSGDKDTIGLAQSYLMKVSKELEANKNNPNLKLRIPFSDPTMVGAFFANVNAGINKKGIRRRYAGIADVLVPSRDMIQTFNIGQGNMMWDDFVDHCRKSGYIKNGVTPRMFIDQKGQLIVLRDPITGTIRKEFHLNGTKHPFIDQVQPNEITSQDYVILVDRNGNVVQEFNVDSFDKFDQIRHRLPEGTTVYKWTCKPKNLQQLDVTYEVNGKTYSIYDLDSVRASHYISQLIKKYGVKEGDSDGNDRVDLNLDPNKLTAEDKFKWDFIQNTIQKVLPKRGFVTYSNLKRMQTIFDRSTILSLKRLEIDQILTQDAFITHMNGNAREWLYRSQVGKTIIDVDPNNYFEIYLKLSSGIRDFADINQYNIPLSMKIALTFDGSLKSLQKIAVDAVQLGLTPEEINDLIKYLRADLNWNEDYFNKLIEEYIPDVIKYNPVKTLNKYNRIFNKQTKHAQVIMGRANAEKFGIRKGDSLYKIKQLKEKFFSDRILAQGKLPHSRMVDSSTYDVMLTGPNGEKLFVAIKSRHRNLNLEGYRNASDVFEKRNDGSIYYNEQEICTAAGKEIYAKPYPGGMVYLMLVDDFSEIEELMESEMYNNQRINYTSNNPADLFLYQYQDSINENGIVDSDIYVKTKDGKTIVIAEGTNINDFINSENFTTKLLTENESIKFEEHVNYIAKQMWTAFETQLFCVGARIPTQSMQSFMGLEVVGFSDSDVNEVYVPAVQTWLQGSDYDIDKLYIMMFEISKKGKLQTFTKLQNSFRNLRMAMDLKYPTGIEYSDVQLTDDITVVKELPGSPFIDDGTPFGKIYYNGGIYIWDKKSNTWINDEPLLGDTYIVENTLIIWNGESWDDVHDFTLLNERDVNNALDQSSVEPYNRVLTSKGNIVVFDKSVSEKKINRFIKNINKHSLSKLSKSQKQSALKNSVVHKILRLMEHPVNQIAAHKPISMAELQTLAKTSQLSKREKYMSSDNPLGKFIMQVQNMVGKDVIGITAVSLKVFFATSTFINQQIQRIGELTLDELENPTEDILNLFNDITFVDSTGQICTLANINLDPLKKLAERIGSDYLLPIHSGITLGNLIQQLEEQSSKIDCAEAISQLLSAATDNAKELILSKINATADFADTWSYLMMNGWTPKEIADYMMSAAFAVVAEYSKTNVFSDIISGSSPEKALNFVLGGSQLSGVDLSVMKLIMGRYRKVDNGDDGCFIDKLIYETYTKPIEENGKIKHYVGEIIRDVNGNPKKRKTQFLTEDQIKEAFEYESDFRAQLLSLLGGEPRERALAISKILKDHVEFLLRTAKKDNSEVEYDEIAEQDDYQNYQEDDFAAIIQEEILQQEGLLLDTGEDDYYEDKIKHVDYSEDFSRKITNKELRNLYRYLDKQVIPKNQKVADLKSEEFKKLEDYRSKMLPGIREQKIIGVILSINQGMKTDEHGHYAKLKQVQNYVNELATDVEDGPFDIYLFLENKEYQDKWIAIMDDYKVRVNPLKLIMEVSHFREMYKLNSMSEKFMQHAVSHRFNMRFEKYLLGDSTMSLSEEEWKIMAKYTNELIQLNWLFSKGITFTMPNVWVNGKQRPVMKWDKDSLGVSILNEYPTEETVTLDSAESAATFVRFFETYIVPTLKETYDNAFTRNLISGNRFSRTHNAVIEHTQLRMNTMIADSSEKTKSLYSEMLQSFNQIAKEVIPGTNLTVQDAVFIYNILVYKNNFTERGFTRILETVALINNDALINDYSEFISYLDSGDIATEGNINPETGEINFGVIKGNIKDLLYRLSFTKSADFKFGVSHSTNSEGAVDNLQFVGMFGEQEQEPIPVGNPDPNDWCLEMPVWSEMHNPEKGNAINNGIQKQYSFTSAEVVMAVTENLIERFGLSDQIQYITDQDIIEAWNNRDNPEYTGIRIKNTKDLLRIKNSKAFLHNGKVYLNSGKITNDTVLHEIMHLICASAKFSNIPEIKEMYYKLLNEAVRRAKADKVFYRNMQERYSEERGSDFKEEILIELLTSEFKHKFKIGFNGLQFSTDIGSYVNTVLNDIFEMDMPVETDPADVGNSKIGDLLVTFNSKLISIDDNPISQVNLNLSSKIKTLKRILIEAGFNGKNSYIKYNC